MNDRVEFYEKNLERVNYWLEFSERQKMLTHDNICCCQF